MNPLMQKRFLRKNMQRVASSMSETRDAIVYEVYEDLRKCKVRIQGSNLPLYARYPENWESTPQYLKPGNAVRIAHRGGNRTLFEIVGHGMNIPTFPNGVEALPGVSSVDTIVTGLQVYPIPGEMKVTIASGTYRINGVVYSVAGVTMLADSDMTMGDDTLMGGDIDVIEFTAPATGKVRYDLLVIGIDGLVDVISSSEVTSNPTLPAVPSSHVKLCHILFTSSATEVRADMINAIWYAAVISSIVVTCDKDIDTPLAWLGNPATIAILAKDQYGENITGSYTLYAFCEEGNGYFDSGKTITTLTTGFDGNDTIAYYRGNVDPGDVSPKVRIEVVGKSNIIYGYALIPLLDVSGELMV